jgi:hypothetical protein
MDSTQVSSILVQHVQLKLEILFLNNNFESYLLQRRVFNVGIASDVMF